MVYYRWSCKLVLMTGWANVFVILVNYRQKFVQSLYVSIKNILSSHSYLSKSDLVWATLEQWFTSLPFLYWNLVPSFFVIKLFSCFFIFYYYSAFYPQMLKCISWVHLGLFFSLPRNSVVTKIEIITVEGEKLMAETAERLIFNHALVCYGHIL